MCQEVIDGVDVGAGQVITLVLDLGGCKVSLPTSFCLSSIPG